MVDKVPPCDVVLEASLSSPALRDLVAYLLGAGKFESGVWKCYSVVSIDGGAADDLHQARLQYDEDIFRCNGWLRSRIHGLISGMGIALLLSASRYRDKRKK